MASNASALMGMRIMGQEARPNRGGVVRAWGVCRPLLSRGGWAQEPAARTRGWLAGTVSPARPASRCGNSHRTLQRHAMGYALDQRRRLLFKANLLRFRAFSRGDGHVLGRLHTCED
jgi:hypothetical protein